MKLFYFGSVCSDEIFSQTVKESKVKPSASAQNFESALLKGLGAMDGLELFAVSAESIAMYPGGNRMMLKKRIDTVAEGVVTHVVPAVNLPFLKQQGHASETAKLLKNWLKENRNNTEKCVLVYGLYPAVVKKIQKICKKHSCRCFCVITDVPSTMFTYTRSKNLFKRVLGKLYRNGAVRMQSEFDGYVYLTEQMSERVAPGKPYVVVETIADTELFEAVGYPLKKQPPAIVYAGALYKKYGIDLILDVFKSVKSDSELWLFGSGDYEEVIREEEKRDPRIKFFGRVDRETVLKAETEASLLLNLRNSTDEYTKYSFPSKMIEYMLSGTPLLTTALPGIPEEYYPYVYVTERTEPSEIAALIDKILADRTNLKILGEKAKRFVMEKKNSRTQAEKIYDFLCRNTPR